MRPAELAEHMSARLRLADRHDTDIPIDRNLVAMAVDALDRLARIRKLASEAADAASDTSRMDFSRLGRDFAVSGFDRIVLICDGAEESDS
jgi:hypothetical protein